MKTPAAVTVESPLRLDFAGGWSDTPPLCHDLGGAVLNAAVVVDGRAPVRVRGRREPEGEFAFVDAATGERRTLGGGDFSDLSDWVSLPRACLALAEWRGGLTLEIDCDLRAGSGLGGSSVLAAAVLACLARLDGRELEAAELVRQTLALEALLTTGGGWQDQAGAVWPGAKLLTTDPGREQDVRHTPLAFPADWPARLVLYDTGRPRLARNILQRIVSRYRLEHRTVEYIVTQLKEGAERAAAAVRRGSFRDFAGELTAYGLLKRKLEESSCPKEVLAVYEAVSPLCLGWTVLGAGGGGFLLLAARGDGGELRRALGRLPGRVHEWDVAETGLEVTSHVP